MGCCLSSECSSKNQQLVSVLQHSTGTGYASTTQSWPIPLPDAKIENSLTSLLNLPQAVDRTLDVEDTKQTELAVSVQKSNIVLSDLYPRAPQSIIQRSSEANHERLRTFLARPEIDNGGLGLIRIANDFGGLLQTQSDHRVVQSVSRARSISDYSATSGDDRIDDELPLTSSATFPSMQRTDHSAPRNIIAARNRANSTILNRPCCKASFRTPADQEEHILGHVQRYHCSYSDCKLGLALFDSPQEWINHEFDEHRIQFHWTCKHCSDLFPHQQGLKDHLCKVHFVPASSTEWKEMLDESREKSSRPVEGEVCEYCRFKGFPNRREYADHVGKHMEQIASRIVLWIIPSKDEVSQEFTEPIEIWDELKKEYIQHSAMLDTQAHDNFISLSVVERLGIKTRKPTTDMSRIRLANNVKIKVIAWAEPRWRTENKNYRDIRFLVLKEIPGTDQMILGQGFSKAQAYVYRSAFVLHNDGHGRGSEEQRRQELQSQDGRADQMKREAAIRALRRKIREPTKSQCESTVKNPQSSGTEAVGRKNRQEKGPV